MESNLSTLAATQHAALAALSVQKSKEMGLSGSKCAAGTSCTGNQEQYVDGSKGIQKPWSKQEDTS